MNGDAVVSASSWMNLEAVAASRRCQPGGKESESPKDTDRHRGHGLFPVDGWGHFRR